jgi:hypothetical protein
VIRFVVVDALIDRARTIVERFIHVDGYIGCFLTGSTVYPGGADAESDLDLAILVEDDAIGRLARRHRPVSDPGPPRRKLADILYLPWSDEASVTGTYRDARRWRSSLCRVVDDPSGRVADVLARSARLDEAFALERMRLHFLELHYCHGKAVRLRKRGELVNAATIVGIGAHAAAKVLAFLHGAWPSPPHWLVQALGHAGVPADAIDAVGGALASSGNDTLDRVFACVVAALDAREMTFHRDLLALDAWHWSAAGQAVAADWGLGVL